MAGPSTPRCWVCSFVHSSWKFRIWLLLRKCTSFTAIEMWKNNAMQNWENIHFLKDTDTSSLTVPFFCLIIMVVWFLFRYLNSGAMTFYPGVFTGSLLSFLFLTQKDPFQRKPFVLSFLSQVCDSIHLFFERYMQCCFFWARQLEAHHRS